MSEEAFLGHTQYRREKHVQQQWREHAFLSETLPHVKLIRALSIIQPHACLHTAVELADDGEHCRWHANTSKDTPQKGSVDGVVCFGDMPNINNTQKLATLLEEDIISDVSGRPGTKWGEERGLILQRLDDVDDDECDADDVNDDECDGGDQGPRIRAVG